MLTFKCIDYVNIHVYVRLPYGQVPNDLLSIRVYEVRIHFCCPLSLSTHSEMCCPETYGQCSNGRRKPHVILCSCFHPPGGRLRTVVYVCVLCWCVCVVVYVITNNSC